MWEWDAGSRQSEKICALCDWYRAEEVDNSLTGKLIESDLSIIEFYSCGKYVCSVPDPCYTNVGESRHSLFNATVTKDLTEFIKKLYVLFEIN